MYIIGVNNHYAANKFWKERLGSKPNGARVLGAAMEKYLAPIIERYYDAAIFYAADLITPEMLDRIPLDKKVFVAVHHNWPKEESFRCWQRVNVKLWGREVDYFCNEQFIIDLIREGGGRAYYLPRFIDTSKYPKTNCTRTIDTLWLGNRWACFEAEYQYYCQSVKKPLCIDGGWLWNGQTKIRPIKREQIPKILAQTKKVWAIGVSQLEAQFYGCDIISYRGGILPFYDEVSIQKYVKKLMEEIN